MDRDFMRSFCRNYYVDYQSEAVKDSEEYQKKRVQRYNIETRFDEILKEAGNGLDQVFEQYLDAYANELEILLEEMYILGASDREKMLKI